MSFSNDTLSRTYYFLKVNVNKFKDVLERKLRMSIREVSLGWRKKKEGNNQRLKHFLENGRNLRKSKALPKNCEIVLNRVWKMSNKQIETIQLNLNKMAQEGKIDEYEASLPIARDQELWKPYPAIIPADGISRGGYVKEVWVNAITETVEIDNQHFTIIDPFVHDSEQWIQGFTLDATNLIHLLPSREIEVKYYRSQMHPLEQI